MNKLVGIILAAGKGARVNLSHTNKVLLKLKGKTLISYPINLLKVLKIPIFVVIKYKKQEIKKKLGNSVFYVEQKSQAGTGGAVLSAVSVLPAGTKNILIMFGDHAFFYTPELVKKIINTQIKHKAAVTFLSVQTSHSTGYGRVIRDQKKQVAEIVEEKNLTPEQKEIKEIVTGLYCFRVSFLRKYKNQLRQHTTTGEYYLSDYVALASQYKKKIGEVKSFDEKLAWGVNTLADLKKIEERTL